MSTAYAPVPTILPATITLPQDLVDQRSAASVNVPFATLADAIAYLMLDQTFLRQIRVGSSVIGATAITAKSGTNVGPFDEIPSTATPIIKFFTGYAWFDDVNNATASTRHICVPLDSTLIDGVVLDSVKLYLQGKAGHAGLPAGMPALSIVRYTIATNTIAALSSGGMVDDPSGSTAAYEALHFIKYACDQNHTIDRSQYTYSAIICNEADTNALSNLKMFSLETKQTAPRYRR